ncbi:MAG: hypothetical protein LBF67_00675, partial [Prevotellaceae bacterium]|nr:hypothetical protein [Prevotellaceae bacterium]
MKTMLKFFLIALLPVAAAVTSCQDADDWKPTWALPIVKDQILRIGDFITDEEVKEINDQVRAEWKGYVNERFSSSDSIGIDSVAYTALTKKDSTYVDFDAQGVPTLNDSTKTLIKENLKTKGESSDVIEAKIDQINDFLKVYHSALELKAQQQSINPSSKARAKPRAEPSGGGEKYYGGDTVVNNLLDAMIHPT